MVRGTFFGLEIGKTGLTTAQFGLDSTSHNIANLDTDGYTRQRIVQTAYDPFATIGRFAPVGQGQVGGGTRVMILDQIRSQYLDRRFRDESGIHAYWETRTQSLSYVESFFDNVNEKTSINYSMAEFFRSMTIIAEDPVSGAPRTLMQTSAMDLVQQLNSIYDGLIDFQRNENRAISTKIGDINNMAKDIAELNVAIYTFEVTGMIANDLRDKRNLLIDELATYVDIEYHEYSDPRFVNDPRAQNVSMMRITVAGDTLVDHDWPKSDVFGVAEEIDPDTGEMKYTPYWRNRVPDDFDPKSPGAAAILRDLTTGESLAELNFKMLQNGELKAHHDMRDGKGDNVDSRSKGIPYYIEMINNLARALVKEVNARHVQGWSDNPLGSETGIKFFDDGVERPATGTLAYRYEGPPQDPGDPGTWSVVGWTFGTVTYLTDRNDPNYDETDTSTWVIGSAEYNITDAQLRNITAKNIDLSAMLKDSAYNIAASSTQIGRPSNDGDSEELQRGNNENIKYMYELFRTTGIYVFEGADRKDIGSFDDYGTTLRFDVGNTLRTAKQAMETSRILTLSANNQRTAIAGVSLDEEMVGLVKFNHAYNGAARVITQMDDALDRLINGTGRVGL